MGSNFPLVSLLLTAILSYANLVSAQTLLFTEVSAKLPTKRAGLSPVYDGFDSIYLIGGYGDAGSALVDVLKYSIFMDSIEKVSQLPEGLHAGCGFRNVDGSFVYVGGYESSSIYSTRTEIGPWSLMSSLENNQAYSGCISATPWSATLFGGWTSSESILEVDLRTGASNRTGQLSEDCTVGSAVWNPLTENATIFCSIAQYVDGVILGYNKRSGVSSQVAKIPRSFFHSSVSFDGLNAYVIGGWNSESLSSWGDEILVFNTVTQESRLASVEGIPSSGSNGTIYDLAGTVYVRI